MISGNGGIDLSDIALAHLSDVVAGLVLRDAVSPDDAPSVIRSFLLAFGGTALFTNIAGSISVSAAFVLVLAVAAGGPDFIRRQCRVYRRDPRIS